MMGAKRRGHSERREKPFGEVRDQSDEVEISPKADKKNKVGDKIR